MRKRKKDREVKQEEAVESTDATAEDLPEGELAEGDEDQKPSNGTDSDSGGDDHLALVEAPEAAVQRLTIEVEEQRERYLRLAAEFDNFRKRVERQRSEIWQNARSEAVRSLLGTLDNLARVTALDTTDTNLDDVIAGVEMVERSLMRELESAGLAKVGTVDEPFDPNDHEAVSTAPAPDEASVDLVAAVLQVGYRFGGTLLRPARVQVYVAAAADEDAGE